VVVDREVGRFLVPGQDRGVAYEGCGQCPIAGGAVDVAVAVDAAGQLEAEQASCPRERRPGTPGSRGDAGRAGRFTEAFGRHDVDAVMAAMTPDCVFEDTSPPDGARHVGADAVRRCREKLFAASPDAVFDAEDVVVAGDRAVMTWRYRWSQDGGGHVRGVDLFRVRDGLIAEKYSYVRADDRWTSATCTAARCTASPTASRGPRRPMDRSHAVSRLVGARPGQPRRGPVLGPVNVVDLVWDVVAAHPLHPVQLGEHRVGLRPDVVAVGLGHAPHVRRKRIVRSGTCRSWSPR
jgi:ketosteroid isomerase-like protein